MKLGLAMMASLAVANEDPEVSHFGLRVDARTGGFEIVLDNKSWTKSAGPPRLHKGGQWLDLVLVDSMHKDDPPEYLFKYAPSAGSEPVLSVEMKPSASNPAFALFETCALVDLEDTAVDPSIQTAKEMLLSASPRFTVEQADFERGFFTYYGQMVGGMEDGTKYGKWGTDPIPSGAMAGPTVVFRPERQGAIAISPASSFMSQSGCHDQASNVLEFGLMGSITSVPAGTCWAVGVAAGATPTDAVNNLGRSLLQRYGKQGEAWAPRDGNADVTISKMSYSTDNGAFYYYNSYPFDSPQEALENTLLRGDAGKPLPVASVLLDSWWYYKGSEGGVTNWTATPEAFPDGLGAFQRQTKLPIIAHNRYWSSETTYARANGGDYDFHIEADRKKAIPLEQRFWDDLLANASRDWGLAVYEQDWLHDEWEGLDAMLQNATLAETWLAQMGLGAERAGVKIQYCMAYSRHALASVAVPAVNQIRVSDDYAVDIEHTHPFSVNLYVGTSSLLAAAIGLAPSKDVFWSTSVQPGAEHKYHNSTEAHPELEALVSVLTAGPVAPGDRFNYTNVSLLRSISSADGTLLKPTWPAVPVDEYYTQRALGRGGPDGELTYAYAVIHASDSRDNMIWTTVLGMDLKSSYSLNLSASLSRFMPRRSQRVAAFRPPLTAASAVQLLSLDGDCDGSTLRLNACGKSDYQHFSLAPVADAPCFTLLGETGKLVPVSSARFSKVEVCPEAGSTVPRLAVTAVGVPGETIEVAYGQVGDCLSAIWLLTASCTVEAGASECIIGHKQAALTVV